MPPKIKTDRQTIVEAAFEVARKKGMRSVTAKSVAEELGTSVGPIFRDFETMEELKSAVAAHVATFFIAYLKEYPIEKSQFMTYGLAYIEFANKEPQLFDILMRSGFFRVDVMHSIVSDQFDFVVASAANVGLIDRKEQAEALFFHVWLYTHGIACLVNAGTVSLSREELTAMLSSVFEAFLSQIKNQGGCAAAQLEGIAEK